MSAVVQIEIVGPGSRKVEGAGVLNGGFSSPSPHVLLPRRVALRLFPDYPAGTTPHGARTVGGAVSLRAAAEEVAVRVLAEDRAGPAARCRVLVSEHEDEILLSDWAIDALGVKIEEHGRGLWRFAGEDRVRPSIPREPW